MGILRNIKFIEFHIASCVCLLQVFNLTNPGALTKIPIIFLSAAI